MAMSKTTNTYNRQKWEDSDFPILCQTCLGDNPYLRMMKEKYGKECKICTRPFTTFRWCPGQKMRFKKTEICQTCSKLKNVCQTCLLDLEYSLPTQVRDSILKVQDNVPKNDVNKEYYIQNSENSLSKTELASNLGPNAGKSHDTLKRLARAAPYYKRNRPHICSFWVKGECKRGEECPYRHEKPTDADNPLSNQNIRDRYYGVNDPVAEKLMKRIADMPALPVPGDTTVTTLYIGNLGTLTEEDIRSHFYQYGEIRTINVVPQKQCGFIQYTTRLAAENAAEQTFNKLILGGRRLTIKWGNSGGIANQSKEVVEAIPLKPVPGLPEALPELSNNFFNINPSLQSLPSFMPPQMFKPLPPSIYKPPQESTYNNASSLNNSTSQFHYPSQDPTRFGSTSSQPKE